MAWSEQARRAAAEARRRKSMGKQKPTGGGIPYHQTKAAMDADYKARMAATAPKNASERKLHKKINAKESSIRKGFKATVVKKHGKLLKSGYKRDAGSDVKGPEGGRAYRKGSRRVVLWSDGRVTSK